MVRCLPDHESQRWWERLHASGVVRRRAIAELHDRLRVEAAFHIRQRTRGRSSFPRSDIDDLAVQAADDALLALLGKLDDYRGDSQFLTWARRFAALEAPVSIRRRVGHDRVGISRNPDLVLRVADRSRSTHDRVVTRELLKLLGDLIDSELTARQRAVLAAVVLNGAAPGDVAKDLSMTSGAVYKSLHDARVKLRAHAA